MAFRADGAPDEPNSRRLAYTRMLTPFRSRPVMQVRMRVTSDAPGLRLLTECVKREDSVEDEDPELDCLLWE